MFESLVNVAKLQQRPQRAPPAPFKATAPGLALDELVAQRFYGAAVEEAARVLGEYAAKVADGARLDAADLTAVIAAWLARFRSLLLLRQGLQVAEEAVACLGELDEPELQRLHVPGTWELRLLVIPAFTKGINHAAIQKLYGMAAEARAELNGSADEGAGPAEGALPPEGPEEWTQRLRATGIYVAAALLGLKDYATAVAHLTTIHTSEKYAGALDYAETVARVLALVHIQYGDTMGARAWIPQAPLADRSLLEKLCQFAEGERKELLGLGDGTREEATLAALATLHTGAVVDAVAILERVLLRPDADSSLLYNVFVMYDLVFEQPREKKLELAEKLATAGVESLGNYDLLK